MRIARHIETRGCQRDIGRCREVQVLAIGVEYRRERIAHSVGDLDGFALRQRVEKHCVLAAYELPRVRDPLTVGRPGCPEWSRLETAVVILIDVLTNFSI